MNMDWIKIKSVKDLPPNNKYVIALDSNTGDVYKAFLTTGGFWNVNNELKSPGSFEYWTMYPEFVEEGEV